MFAIHRSSWLCGCVHCCLTMFMFAQRATCQRALLSSALCAITALAVSSAPTPATAAPGPQAAPKPPPPAATGTVTAAAAATTVTIDGAAPGRTFDGVGAVSGGGGNSRLLIDYPEPQRGQILDYMFKPGYGAALQILKVEIGGDTNSTSGAEPSHQHTRGDLDCNRGYQWWIMEQAKARNPNIKLAALAWGAPGWLGNGTFMSTDTINYLISWLGCAKQHNLTIDYMTAAQNEKKTDANWTIQLRAALNANGYNAMKIIYGDDYPGSWGPANAVNSNAALRNVVDVIGGHYTCG